MQISQQMKYILAVPAISLGLAATAISADDNANAFIPVTTNSEEALAHFEMGRALLDRGDGPDASGHFKQAVEIDPDFALAWVNIANSSASFAEFAEASRKAVEASEGKSKGEQILTRINMTFVDAEPEERLSLAKKLTGLYPNSPRAWIVNANANAGLNRSAEARACLNRAIALDEDFSPSYTTLGFSYLFAEPKDFDKAADNFGRVAALEPNNDNAWVNVGDAYRARKELEKSLEAYEKATKLDATNGVALAKKGHVGSFLGHYDEARADYDKSVEVSRPQVQSFYAVYGAYTYVHEGKPAAALEALEGVLKMVDEIDITDDQRPGARAFALTSMATIALHTGMYNAAESAIERLAVQLRDNAKRVGGEDQARLQEAAIAIWEGQLAARRGDYETASAKAAENARLVEADANPRKLEAHHALKGLISLSQGNFDEAVAHYEQADHANTMYVRYYLGLALAGAGQNDRAKAIFREAGEWNFNSVGFSLFRKDALERAGSS